VHSIAKPILIIAGIIFTLCAVVVLCLNIYLQSAGVQLKLRQAVFRGTGFEPVITQTYYTPWSGLVISGIKIPQPVNAKKPLLSVRSMKCSLRLSSLLQGKLVIKDMSFEQPSLILLQGQSGVWPSGSAFPFQGLEKKSAAIRQPTQDAGAPKKLSTDTAMPPQQASTPAALAPPRDSEKQEKERSVSVENIHILEGQAFLYPAQGGRPIRFEGCSAEGKLLPDGSATGDFRVKNASFAELARCTEITGIFEYHDGYLKITELQAVWANGTVTGSLEMSNGAESFFTGSLAAENVSLQKLAEEAGFTPEGTQGFLFAKTNLQGIPGKPESFTGEASAHLTEARMQPIDPLRQLGEMLRINELRVLELQTAETALTIRDGKIIVDRLELESANLLMDATGEARLDGALDLDARFHIGNKMLKESLGFMGSKFKPSGREGYSHMPFSITGTLSRPKSDLLDKLIGIRLGDDVGGLLKNLLRMPKKEKKKNKPDATPAPTN
jgi:type II secretion system protein N